ncbi:MAG: acetyl-CoA carboxylase carboxyltransferase subunit alpha [Acidobacteria bacterium]|nr:acetyl-CoA carboxylase carboxyltransferase subunit alpha [Acidobacteriota bacterium]
MSEPEKERLEMERGLLEEEATELASLPPGTGVAEELQQLEKRLEQLRNQIHSDDSAMGRVKLARHPERPYMLDFVQLLFEGFSEIHGDRRFADDPAMVCGMARFHGEPVVVIGQQKGRDIKQRQFRNFGHAQPDGYRKALRVMKLAEKFSRPVFTFIDTPGAYPGLEAEERGQAEAIAYNLREMARLRTPIIATVTGEGGSGGALAIGVGDVVNMLENTVYSVISPEGCAAILWKDASKAPLAAEAMRITAPDLLELGIIDRIVPEPPGGAHLDWDQTAKYLDQALIDSLKRVRGLKTEEMLKQRYLKFRSMGRFEEVSREVARTTSQVG